MGQGDEYRAEGPTKGSGFPAWQLLVGGFILLLGVLLWTDRLWCEKGEICAVCGRERIINTPFLLGFSRIRPSPATVYCDRIIGPHQHIWVFDYANSLLSKADGFAHSNVPICDNGIVGPLATLDGTPYLKPVVEALCDVDNWFVLLARDALVRRPPPAQNLEAWWEQNKRWFQVEHDAQRALTVFRDIYPNEEFSDLWEAVLRTKCDLNRFGGPTVGASSKTR
jgi:hypothetical protein